MRVKLEILTPVHISSGAEISPSGYYIDQKRRNLNVVNLNHLFSDPDFKKYQVVFMEKAATSRYLGEIIPDYNLLNRHTLYSLPTSPDFRSQNKINIKAFIKSAGRVYLPGSSIKGAIISALLYRALQDLSKSQNISTLLTSRQRSAYDDVLDICYDYLSGNSRSRSTEDYRDEKKGQKFLSLFSVSDTNWLEPDKCLRADICQVEGARGRRQIPIMYETLRLGITFEFDLKINKCRFTEKQILEICDNFYRKVAQKENLRRPESPYLLRLGQGSSCYAMSFLIAAEDLRIQGYQVKPPRTRKRIKFGREIEMGFVRLEITAASAKPGS